MTNAIAHALIVDDAVRLVDAIESEIRKLCGHLVSVERAGDADEAKNKVETGFYNYVVVDLQLNTAVPQLEGFDIAKKILDLRPAAHLIIVTGYAVGEETSRRLFELLKPANTRLGLSHPVALLDRSRNKAPQQIAEYIWRDIKRQAASTLGIPEEHMTEIASRLSKRVSDWKEFNVRDDAKLREIYYVMVGLFDRSLEWSQVASSPDGHAARNVEIKFEERGASASCVFYARTEMERGQKGNWVVVKIGSTDVVLAEARAYERFVRYDVAAASRVELLGITLANNIGGIAFSLAGSSPGESDSLKDLIVSKNYESAIVAIRAAFSPGAMHWHGTKGIELMTVQEYIRKLTGEVEFETFRFEFIGSIRSSVRRTNQRSQKGEKLWIDEPLLRVGDESIRLPMSLGMEPFYTPFETCIVHGDLHAENLLVLSEQIAGNGLPAVKLIDYATTDFGPRASDLVALAGSVRLLTAGKDTDLLQCLKSERRLWRTLWSCDLGEFANDAFGESVGEWASTKVKSADGEWYRVCLILGVLTRLDFPALTEIEVAAMTVAYGSYLGRLPGSRFSKNAERDAARLRIAVWLDPAATALSQ